MSSNATSCYLWKHDLWSVCDVQCVQHTFTYKCVVVSACEFVRMKFPGAVAVEFAPRNPIVKYPFHLKFCFLRNACAKSGRWRRALQFLIEAIAYKAVSWNLENSVKKWAKIKISPSIMWHAWCWCWALFASKKWPPLFSGCSECCVWGDAFLRRCKWTSPLLASLWVVQVAARNGR